MRTILFRALLAPAVLLALTAAPVFAQSVVRGKVVDQEGNPVEGAIVVFEDQEGSRRIELKTNRNGEYQQIGMPSGTYRVSASKDNVGVDAVAGYAVLQQVNPVLEFKLAPEAARGPDLTVGTDGNRLPDAVRKQIEGAVAQAFEAMAAKNFDAAIEQFNLILTHVPACIECHFNVAIAHAQSGRADEAEKSFLKVIELEPESADAHRGLAAVYNLQRRFDDAAKANERVAELSGGAVATDGNNADLFYNQAVILWNSGQAEKAKEQFERAAQADPTLAMPHYFIGLANLNLGQLAEAKAAFQKYLEIDPEGEKAGEVKAFVSQLP
jgi:tetratricopeptide (TPR) repeat protein